MHAILKILAAAAGFLALEEAGTACLRRAAPSYTSRLAAARRLRRYTSYVPSLAHALLTSAAALSAMQAPRPPPADTAVSAAYFLYDFVRADMSALELEGAHHIIGWTLAVLMLVYPDNPAACIVPYVQYTEISTVFLCLSVLARGLPEMPVPDPAPAQRALAKHAFLAFAFFFAQSRVAMLPFVLQKHAGAIDDFHPAVGKLLWALVAIQAVWLARIVRVLNRHILK